MGQGFILANLDKKEFVSPHDLGLGYKLGEFGTPKDPFAGSLVQFARELTATDGKWHGDRVFYFGDYGDVYTVEFETVNEMSNEDGYNYSLAYDEYTRYDKQEIRAWVATKVDPEDLAFRRRLWASHDKVDKHFANK